MHESSRPLLSRVLVTGLMFAITAALCLFPISPASAQQNFDNVEIETVRVADGVYVLFGAGGNIGVSAGPDGIVLIDDQYAPLTDKIFAALQAIPEAEGQKIRFVLNTHWHGDHTGGNENMAGAGALIVAHDGVRARMTEEQFLEVFDNRVPPSPKDALPVVTYSDAATFHVNDHEIHAFHVPPAHTDGDSLVHFRGANVMHLGDTFFNGMYPFIDVSTGGNLPGMIHSANKALAVAAADTTIIPGHGPVASRDDLVAYRDMLQAVHDAVHPHFKDGKSRDEVVAADPLNALNEIWGGGFMKPDVFVGIVYDGFEALGADHHHGHSHEAQHHDHDGHTHKLHDQIQHGHEDHLHDGHHEHHDGHSHETHTHNAQHHDHDGHPHEVHDQIQHGHEDHLHDGHNEHHDGHSHEAHKHETKHHDDTCSCQHDAACECEGDAACTCSEGADCEHCAGDGKHDHDHS